MDEISNSGVYRFGDFTLDLDRAAFSRGTDEIRLRPRTFDVLVYLVQIAHQLGIDPVAAAHAKIAKNALKYPVEKSRGIAKKYDEL